MAEWLNGRRQRQLMTLAIDSAEKKP